MTRIQHAKIVTKENTYEYSLWKEFKEINAYSYLFNEYTNNKLTYCVTRSSKREAKELFDEYVLGIKQGLISMEISFTQEG